MAKEGIVSKKRLFFVRHGKTEWNGLSRFQGKSDILLNDEGRRQAFLLSARLRPWGPFALFSSSLSRARETAEIIASRQKNVSVVQREELSEMGFGRWEGHSLHEIESRDPESFQKWKTSPFEFTPPEGEPFSSVVSRVEAVLNEIRTFDGEKIVVVSHGGILRAALVLLLDLPLSAVWRMKISNCSVTCVDLGRRGSALAFLNDEVHVLLPLMKSGKIPFPA